MKTLTSSLISALNSQEPIYFKKFLLYTRTWQAATQTYTFSAAQDITKYVLETSKIKWKADNEGYSIWNNAVLNLTLSNLDDYFSPNNFFWGGAKVEVYISAKTAAGNANEEIKIFRGFVLNGPVYDKENRAVRITLNGELALLGNLSASGLTQSTALETLTPDIDTPTKTFYTQNNAVYEITALYQGATESGAENATLLKAQNDYKVSDLEEYNKPAKITLNIDLPATDSLWCSYRYYYTDKTCEWIANKIADIYGAAARQIDPVFYSSTIEASYACPAYNDFSEGTLTDVEINNNALQLKDNFLTNTNYDWTVLSTPSNATVSTTPSSILVIGPALSGQAVVRAPATQAYGTWEAEISIAHLDDVYQYNYFISSSDNLANTNGYTLGVEYSANMVFFDLYRIDNGQKTIINEWYYNFGYVANRIRYRLTRDANGTFKIWVKTVSPSESAWYQTVKSVETETDNTYTASSYQFFQMVGYGGNNLYNYQTSPLIATGSGTLAPYGNYLSPVISGGGKFQ